MCSSKDDIVPNDAPNDVPNVVIVPDVPDVLNINFFVAVTAPSRSRSRPTTGVRCNCDCVSLNRSTTFRPPTGVPRSSNVSFNLANINLVRSVVPWGGARHPPTPPPLTNSSFFRIPVYLVLGALSTSTSTSTSACPCLPQLLASRNATPRTPAFFGVTDRDERRPV